MISPQFVLERGLATATPAPPAPRVSPAFVSTEVEATSCLARIRHQLPAADVDALATKAGDGCGLGAWTVGVAEDNRKLCVRPGAPCEVAP